ncbi:unnamed protein product [Caenorhabditis angaria]|uniref:Uncharacterized protein n=1 Tax=Caenorhabditis angaria TaxID=860376 RepID=A0A9P1IR49_9PELO|nr:unnamed protein product [Caenorhabditis angaria]
MGGGIEIVEDMEINEKTQEPIVLMKKMLIRLLRSTKEKIEAEKKTYEVVFNEIAESAKIDGNYQALLEKSIRLKKEFDEKTDVRTFDLLHKTLLSIENEVEFKELMIEMTPPICDRVLIKNPNSTSTNPNSWETLRNRIRQIGDLKFIDKISKIPF